MQCINYSQAFEFPDGFWWYQSFWDWVNLFGYLGCWDRVSRCVFRPPDWWTLQIVQTDSRQPTEFSRFRLKHLLHIGLQHVKSSSCLDNGRVKVMDKQPFRDINFLNFPQTVFFSLKIWSNICFQMTRSFVYFSFFKPIQHFNNSKNSWDF